MRSVLFDFGLSPATETPNPPRLSPPLEPSQTGMRRETEQASNTRVNEEPQAVDALIDHADGDQIWQVLDYRAPVRSGG